MESKQPDILAYIQFLLNSNMSEGIRTEAFIKEPLARSILNVLENKGLLTRTEVLKEFTSLMNEQLLDLICPEELERNPGLIPLKVDFSKPR